MRNVDLSAEPEKTRELSAKAVSSGVVVIPIRYHRKKNGTVFPVEINATSLVWNGRQAFIPAIRDITERKASEEKIQTLLTEKELLLKEVHHRIKNNMNTMVSLLLLQSRTLKDLPAIAALQDARSRMQSMGMLYDRLYRSENFREISMKDYLPPLIDEIVRQFPGRDRVTIETETADFLLTAEVLSPLGILVNELVTNAMKYAFTGRDEGVIRVSASLKDNQATLVFEDNGIGIPESVDITASTGFGLQLVALLAKQLKGSIRLERGNGSKFIIEFRV